MRQLKLGHIPTLILHQFLAIAVKSVIDGLDSEVNRPLNAQVYVTYFSLKLSLFFCVAIKTVATNTI